MTRPLVLVQFSLALSIAAAMPAPRTASAITLGQVDAFDSGVAGWGGSPTSNVAGSLSVNSSNRVVTFNELQWTGDYIAAGVSRITMDVLHQNPFNLQLRLGIAKGPFGSTGSGDTYVTNDSISVPNDGSWHTISFDVTPSDFVASFANTVPTPNAAAALAAVSHLRILHNPEAGDFRGAPGGGEFRLDNITALAAAPAVDADFDGDLDVDGADFLIWQRSSGGSGDNSAGDADGNGQINGLDLAAWQDRFGQPAAVAAVAVVPESDAVVMLAIAGLVLTRLRRAWIVMAPPLTFPLHGREN